MHSNSAYDSILFLLLFKIIKDGTVVVLVFLKMSKIRAEKTSSEMWKVAGLAVLCVVCFTSSAVVALSTNIPTLTPHMQSASKASDEKRTVSSKNTYGDQEQTNSYVKLWKKAFKDACERLCPVRAAGHECGCLPVLARLVMEQCVNRLDVAMFNAILRESVDDIPTDPISDPIRDSKVLPIPAGNSSVGVGVGAQLKNVVR
ncbi:nucleolar-like protein [Thalictrum thalictroides]|uniref:Nucleolar-like protein n=1 Tax=Thalictrum thalictroides TaxID=46969 RepID=A0A7J6XFQ2_THATH|nr:nucleolar-like protein [Thalictrum thalictroides]